MIHRANREAVNFYRQFVVSKLNNILNQICSLKADIYKSMYLSAQYATMWSLSWRTNGCVLVW